MPLWLIWAIVAFVLTYLKTDGDVGKSALAAVAVGGAAYAMTDVDWGSGDAAALDAEGSGAATGFSASAWSSLAPSVASGLKIAGATAVGVTLASTVKKWLPYAAAAAAGYYFLFGRDKKVVIQSSTKESQDAG